MNVLAGTALTAQALDRLDSLGEGEDVDLQIVADYGERARGSPSAATEPKG